MHLRAPSSPHHILAVSGKLNGKMFTLILGELRRQSFNVSSVSLSDVLGASSYVAGRSDMVVFSDSRDHVAWDSAHAVQRRQDNTNLRMKWKWFTDKAVVKAWMDTVGLTDFHPKTYPPPPSGWGNATLAALRAAVPSFPVFVKVAGAHSKKGVFLATNAAHVRTHLARLESYSLTGELFLEEAISAQKLEFTVFFSAVDGNLRGVVCSRSTRSLSLKILSKNRWVGTCDWQTLDMTRRFVRLSRYNGIGCIDYAVATGGRPMLFDLNARMCGEMSTSTIGPVILNKLFCGLVGCVRAHINASADQLAFSADRS